MSSQSRFFKFWTSPKGQNVAMYSIVVSALSAGGISFLPNTFLIEKHREIVAAYRNGSERQLTETVKKRYELAIELLKINDFERHFMKPFMIYGFDLYSIGSTNFRFSALTGIPSNYSYSSASDIEKSDINIRGKPVDWNSTGGKNLEHALVLTDDEQVFGIAREILQLQNHQVLLNSIYPCASIIGTYALASAINTRMGLLQRPISVRGFLYILVGLFGYGIYSFLTDATQVSIDGKTDEKMASLGRPFIEAGIRFYEKLLKKNMAIRELTGDNTYSAMGNENFILRTKRLPLTFRKTFFELKLKELNEQEKKSSEQE